MPPQHLTEHHAPDGETIYQDDRCEVRIVALRSSDEGAAQSPPIRRALIVHPGAVVILPILSDGSVVLIRNDRWSLGRPLLELPAGGLDPEESPLAAAGRELIEETGYQAEKITPFGSFFAAPGTSNEVMHAFIATDLAFVGQRLQPDEKIEVVTMTREAVRMAIVEGQFEDGKTLAILGRWLLSST
ncbi:MAG: NUDIX hydrolase [Myxococcales bacterium]|nr:NUDIX hydrolase [Myxococcales bacterium]